MNRYLMRVVMVLMLMLFGRGGAVAAQGLVASPGEYQVKAVLLYNMARYTEWPNLTRGADFVICVFGRDPFGDSLEMAVEGERLGGSPVIVRRPSTLNGLNPCHMLFVAPSKLHDEGEVLRHVAAKPILTVGDSEEFIFNGGMVRFFSQGSKVKFAINPDAVTEANLKVSANLLYIARIIRRPSLAGRSEP